MNTLFIYKSEPDNIQIQIIDYLKNKNPNHTSIKLYEGNVDWDLVIDLIFNHKKIISWW